MEAGSQGMVKRRIASIMTIAAVSLLAVLAATKWLSSELGCADEPVFPPVREHVRATRVEVEPWRGRHRVYGEFAVPLRYRSHRLYKMRLRITGVTETFPEISPEAGRMRGSAVEPGYYTMRVNIPTRMALWFLVTGRLADLKTPCRWSLLIEDRQASI